LHIGHSRSIVFEMGDTMADVGSVKLSLLEGRLAVSRLDKNLSVPDWALNREFVSVTVTGDELSIVCPESLVPSGVRSEKGWRCLKVAGPLDFSLTGVLAGLLNPLARAGIGVFAISTYDTDYILVKEENLQKTTAALTSAGYHVGIAPL
jgi:hypothetical protein